MDSILKAYLRSVVDLCERLIDEPLTAAWMVGSLATDDFEALRSDVDLLVVCPSALLHATKAALARELSHDVLTCPAHGLDLVIYREEEVRRITRIPEYEFSLSSGVDWQDEASMGGPYPGGLVDLALSRQLGRVLVGPRPGECVGPIPERWVVEELLAGLRWHAGKVHDPFHDPTGSNAVLNACRALHYLSRRKFVSKRAGAEWLLGARAVPVVAAALAGRSRRPDALLDRDEVVSFLEEVIAEFEAGPV